jgi:hypothetical protein
VGLIANALETQEDLYLSRLGDKILASNKKWYAHDEVWNLKNKKKPKIKK